MKYTELDIAEFYLIGISTRTINNNGTASKDIGELWNRFFNEKIDDKVDNKLDNSIFNLYHDYETDHNGEYGVIVGFRVTNLDNVPKGLTGVTVPASKYAVYEVNGELPAVVMDTWGEIYKSKKFKRTFTSDFDIYNKNIMDPENCPVRICVAIEE